MASSKRRVARIDQELEELEAPLVVKTAQPIETEGDDDGDGDFEDDTAGLDIASLSAKSRARSEPEEDEFEATTPVGDQPDGDFGEKTNLESGATEADGQSVEGKILDPDEFDAIEDPSDAVGVGAQYDSLDGESVSTAVEELPDGDSSPGSRLVVKDKEEDDLLAVGSDDDDELLGADDDDLLGANDGGAKEDDLLSVSDDDDDLLSVNDDDDDLLGAKDDDLLDAKSDDDDLLDAKSDDLDEKSDDDLLDAKSDDDDDLLDAKGDDDDDLLDAKGDDDDDDDLDAKSDDDDDDDLLDAKRDDHLLDDEKGDGALLDAKDDDDLLLDSDEEEEKETSSASGDELAVDDDDDELAVDDDDDDDDDDGMAIAVGDDDDDDGMAIAVGDDDDDDGAAVSLSDDDEPEPIIAKPSKKSAKSTSEPPSRPVEKVTAKVSEAPRARLSKLPPPKAGGIPTPQAAMSMDSGFDDDEPAAPKDDALEMDSGLDDLALPDDLGEAAAPPEPPDTGCEIDPTEEGQVPLDAQITPLKVMFGCAMHKSSGSLRFRGANGGFKLNYVEGSIVEVFTNVEKQSLPTFLIDNEVCDEDTVKKAQKSLETERAQSLQDALIKRNLAPAASINRATVLWAKSILGEIIRIDSGVCHFSEAKVRVPVVSLAFGPWQAPIDAVRASFLKRDLERRLAGVMDKAASLNPAGTVNLDDVAFQAGEKSVITGLDGAKTVKQTVDALRSDQAQQMNALRAIFVGIEAGLLVAGSPREVAQIAKAKEILEQYAKLKDSDEYDILGVPRSANAQLIRARIQELKKIYAGDPEGEIPALQDAKAQLFSLFEKAVRTFSARKEELGKPRVLARPVSVMEKTRSPAGRDGSVADAAPVAAAEDNATKAKKLFDQAEAAAKKGSYKEATEKLDRATELDPDRRTFYKVHQLYYAAVSDKADRLEAAKAGIKEIEVAMTTGSQVAEGWVLIGRLYKFAREKEQSAKAFEKALGLDPNNQEAKTEVNMAQRRGLSSAEVLAAGSRGPASSAFSFLKKKIEETSQKTGIKLPTFEKKKEPERKKGDARKARERDREKEEKKKGEKEDDDDDIP
ncbi:MAG: tetratricopeptide repeat protein [Deltaproteobacteria bacterium]|nr:tetratricopeptide repeat protein [Deltaproteobacteria bacterium]